MKKTYTAPEIEISLFETEEVLGDSILSPGSGSSSGTDLPIIGL